MSWLIMNIVIRSEPKRENPCSVTAASNFVDGKSLPSSPWSYKKLPFASWPAAILVRRHTDDANNCFLSRVRAVCDVTLKKGARYIN